MNAPTRIVAQTRAFKSGNSVAVRLPKDLGVSAGERVELVRRGRNIEIRPVVDADYERAQLAEMVRELREIGPIKGDPEDGRIEFPERPGLY